METKINVDVSESLLQHLDRLAASIKDYFAPPTLEAIADPELQSRWGLPKFATPGSAAIDLRAVFNTERSRKNIEAQMGRGVRHWGEIEDDSRISFVELDPGAQVMIDSGLQIHINDPGYAGLMLPRSGTGRDGLVLANGTGLIDSDYQGPLMMILWNRGDKPILIEDGDRVAQYVLTNVHQFQMAWRDAFSDASERGEGGFGSTGQK